MPKSKTKRLKDKLWKLVSEYVRRRHADSNGYVQCYTCGVTKHWKEGDAGHAIGGRKNGVLFDLDILRFQCKRCNGPGSGEQYIFGKKLNQEYGEGWFEKKRIEAKKPKEIYDSDYEDMIESIEKMLEEL